VSLTNLTISDLRDRPEFAGDVADRVWRAWWQPKNYPLAHIERLVSDNLGSGALPFAVVGHDEKTFMATASVIVSDMEDRPQYTPWVAAVWVEPQFRGKGVGSAIVTRAAALAFERGFETVYLCALPEKCGFYEALGWMLIEDGRNGNELGVLTLSR
jgi:GNAT superfamily N-acetyltransferase